MKPSDIAVGGKYSNPTTKYGGIRIVDAFVTRSSGQVACVWRNGLQKSNSNGHSHGVSALATFARWARAKETMTDAELVLHLRCAEAHAEMYAKYGKEVAQLLSKS